MQFIDRLRCYRSSIVVKLILLNLLILLSIGGVVVVNLMFSHQIGDTLKTIIDNEVSRAIQSAELSRNLNTMFAEMHLLLNTFTEREDLLDPLGDRLIATLRASIVHREPDAISDALVRFKQTLETLLVECALIFRMSEQIRNIEQELDTQIAALDELVTALIIDRKIAGKDYELFALEQVSASIPDYRSLLLQIAMQLANLRRDYLGAALLDNAYGLQIQSKLEDISASLLVSTTAGDELVPSGKQIIATVERYKAAIIVFQQAMRVFQTRFSAMSRAQAQVSSLMQTLENEIAQTAGHIREDVDSKIQASRQVTLIFSVIILTLLVGIGISAIKIIRPILHLTASASSIAEGNLDTPIDSSGVDEIGRLARSFVHMRDVIRAEMDALAEKNTTLLVETAERKRVEESLRLLNDELEQRVHQRTLDLETANKELKEFAYVVSHDLKAPLRGISRLAQWLEKDYADKLGEEGQEQLNLLAAQVRHMSALIDGVLRYSRAIHGSECEESIDLNVLVPQVIAMLMPPARITIRLIEELPVIYGDPIRIMQVFQNLLNNAVKFMDKPDGQITVHCEDTGALWTFHVEDNGPGIDPRHHERIFQIFQTNTSPDQSESTGIGLTVVKKIVELYGGRVWVESTVGQGSRFSFTWPKQSGDRQ
ncbi:multi-sensor signal transduction histidine kinase [Candidatus Vecturithrix granuli]|uniref:histidine kinase n=1 Tax=Vecturithrix granuli TaxID=1499967 RepID=A0A0S6WAN0_VECG1|nr:multi-sensor signal transduction histidine kinase [Candidatus Vecturithrix granuli]